MDYLIGHLLGDYIFQNDWMAQNKKAKWFNCVIHCLIYTLCVCLLTKWFEWYKILLVFLSHIILDKTFIVYSWMQFFGCFSKLRQDLGGEKNVNQWLWTYAIIDNSAHLFFLFLISKI